MSNWSNTDGIFHIEYPTNEPVLEYLPGSPEVESLKQTYQELAKNPIDIPLIINGKEIFRGDKVPVVMPHNHQHVLAQLHQAESSDVQLAIDAALSAQKSWAALPWYDRLAIFQKAAELLATKYRFLLNAATMAGQSKTCHQAEIDSACELVDFLRYNVYFATEILSQQPDSSQGIWNRLDYRPLEGFVFALTPFNFTAIGGNLPTAPAMMGNTVVWKPANTAALSAYYVMKLLQEAGLPDGVINFIPGNGPTVGDQVFAHPKFAGLHFTGSTQTFNSMWKTIASNLDQYRTYPRIVGETGGKDFVIAHPSALPEVVVANLVRGAFEFQGQKCSAASRAYLPRTLWDKIKNSLISEVETITMGDPSDFKNFMGAVIDQKSFDRIKSYIEYAKDSGDSEVLIGGNCDDSKGYFVEPTVILTKDPSFKLMEEEIFGPVLTIYIYPDSDFEQALELVDSTSPYGLTGAIIAQDRAAVHQATARLRFAAGNFYINDKPTGAVVGQQPFGGARGSGTNDKAGSALNLLRWVSPRNIKENFVPTTNYRYGFHQ